MKKFMKMNMRILHEFAQAFRSGQVLLMTNVDGTR